MPWTHKLVRAEVQELHVGPGARVAPEEAVLTLVSAEGKHVIRAAHAGRLIPLVSPGDAIIGGDPLYVLRREEEPVRREPVIRGAEGAPMAEQRPQFAGLVAFADRFGHWGWFVLALGAYGLAARLAIPQLQRLLGDADADFWKSLLAASIGAGVVMFGVLAQLGRGWPKRMTWGLAACWAGLSTVALTDLPERMQIPVERLDVTGPEIAAAIGLTGPEEGGEIILAEAPAAAPAADFNPVPSAPATEPSVVPQDARAPEPAPAGDEAEGLELARLDPQASRGGEAAVLRSGVSAGLAPSPIVTDLTPLPDAPDRAGSDGTWSASLSAALPQPGAGRRLADGPETAAPAPEPVLTAASQLPEVPAQTALSAAERVNSALAEPARLPNALPSPQGEPADAPALSDLAALDPVDQSLPEIATVLLRRPGFSEPEEMAVTTAPAGNLEWQAPQDAPVRPVDLAAAPVPGVAVPSAPIAAAAETSAPFERVSANRLALAVPAGPLPRDQLIERLEPELEGPLAKVDTSVLTARAPDAAPLPRPAALIEAQQPRLASAAPFVSETPAPLPWLQPRYANVFLLFQYLEDPRSGGVPEIGESYGADLPEDVSLAIRRSTVTGTRPMVQVSGWCRAAGGLDVTAENRRVALSDRLRLVLVELEIEADTVGMLSDVLPIFGGQDVGFFHNRRPMMGGWSGPQLLARGEIYMQARSNRQLDPNFPEIEGGGTYFFAPDAAVEALSAHGCTDPVWQGGSPATAMGSSLDRALR